MIIGFKHKGLETFFETGSKSGVRPEHANRLRLILGVLNAAASTNDINLPGLRLHRLKGTLNDVWAVRVSGNWRVCFRFCGEDVFEVDYLDYH